MRIRYVDYPPNSALKFLHLLLFVLEKKNPKNGYPHTVSQKIEKKSKRQKRKTMP